MSEVELQSIQSLSIMYTVGEGDGVFDILFIVTRALCQWMAGLCGAAAVCTRKGGPASIGG